VNKLDRLGESDLAAVLQHLEQGFSELVEAILPVSAKQALEAQLAADQSMLTDSRFPALREFLERRLFGRSRRLKREGADRRLVDVLEAARRRCERELSPLQELQQRAADELGPAASFSIDRAVEAERQLLHAALEQVCQRAAAEVLDFVRPGRWVFDGHRTERADRDFLLELLLADLRQVAQESAARVAAELTTRVADPRQALAEATPGAIPGDVRRQIDGLRQLLDEQRRLLKQQVYGRFEAFSRGYLLGGRIDHFFGSQIPELKLERKAIVEALVADLPSYENELLTSLQRWFGGSREALVGALRQLGGELELRSFEIEAATLEPLDRLREQLRAASSAP